ncbi:MAG TPA: DnaJ domain-containing protein [Bdellovibrionales bacterium]|nr:DnaJ domain-containing protein [Bdellovibrionales bacterium]
MAAPVENPLVRGFRELLGVDARATPDDIKKAYRRLAVLYHPDRNPDPEAKAQFVKITEAYEALGDPALLRKLNKKYLREQLYEKRVEGLNIRFGSFFGYRVFSAAQRVPKALRLGVERAGEADSDIGVLDFNAREESSSILDNPAFDSLELVYGGKFSLMDEERMQTGFKGSQLGRLPWVVLNNKGILLFLDGKFDECLEVYRELNERVPNNIIFLFRLGLCEAIAAFRKKRRTLLGRTVPDAAHLKRAIEALRKAIHIGENRPVGKQKGLTIRKTLAEILEKSGNLKAARQVWRDVYDIDPRSREAIFKLQGSLRLLAGARK